MMSIDMRAKRRKLSVSVGAAIHFASDEESWIVAVHVPQMTEKNREIYNLEIAGGTGFRDTNTSQIESFGHFRR